MLRWLQRLGASTPPSPSDISPISSPIRTIESVATSAWNAAFASDPTEWESGFDECWNRAVLVLDRSIEHPERDVSFNEMTELMALLSRMCQYLMMEVNAQPEPAIGAILDRFFTHQIIERVLDWAQMAPEFLRPTCQLSLIRIYEGIVAESHSQNHCLLVHKPILNPLLRLFAWCRKPESIINSHHREGPTTTDQHFVLLLNQICTKMAEDSTLMHFFFTCTDEFMVFSLLIPFLYEQLARDALLLILSVSSTHQDVAEFVAYKSAFCPVVSTGLSGCFSQLSFVLSGDGSERMLPESAAIALSDFHSSLVFCNAVVQAAHEAVVKKITEYFYSGFLIPVVKPALLQDEKDAVTAATVYLQVCLETVTEEPLIKTMIQMILTEKDDHGHTLISLLLHRIDTADKLGVVSLALLEVLLDLVCEDVMLVLALRQLLPLRHTTRQQVSRVRDRMTSMAIAKRLLAAIPEAMQRFPEVSSCASFTQYLHDGISLVERRAKACSTWKWRYDGVHPSPVLFRGDSDEEPAHTPFTRLSSVRSSLSSATHGLNRYFSTSTRTAHLTSDSLGGGLPVRIGRLGPSPPLMSLDQRSPTASEEEESPVEEDDEFVLPPISNASVMQSSMMDFLTLTAYDSLSESDNDKENIVMIDETMEGFSAAVVDVLPDHSGESSSSIGFDTDAEMARGFVLSGWTDVKDMDTFKSLLDRRPLPSKKGGSGCSLAETMSFIDSKLQYIGECEGHSEREDSKSGEDETSHVYQERGMESTRSEEATRGQPIEEEFDRDSNLLDILFHRLETICEQSYAFNLQMCSVLYSLAAYPQPLLAAYLFSLEGSPRIPHLLSILESAKEQVDLHLSLLDGADMSIRRSLRNLQLRADRLERAPDAVWPRPVDGFRQESGQRDVESARHAPLSRARPFTGSSRRFGFKYHSHLAIEHECAREDVRTRDTVHAAILLANLCQFLAAIVLQHAVVVAK